MFQDDAKGRVKEEAPHGGDRGLLGSLWGEPGDEEGPITSFTLGLRRPLATLASITIWPQFEGVPSSGGGGSNLYELGSWEREGAFKLWEAAARLQISLATKLRITPQSRSDPRTIGRHEPPRGTFPWEIRAHHRAEEE